MAMEYNDILSVAIDAVRGVNDKFSAGQTSDELRAAFIELNGGSDKINPKTFYRGNPLFELIQELIPVMIDEGFKREGNPLFDHIDYRNIAYGDEIEFTTDGDAGFVVAEAANGIQGVRRQRLTGGETVTIPTKAYAVRVYENLGRLLAKRIDFNKFVEGIAKAFDQYILTKAYEAIAGISSDTKGLDSTYVVTGSYSEDSLLTLIDHVEAATGKTARILGTRAALRKVTTAVVADSAKEDMYNLGYYGRFNGTDMYALKQVHVPGTNTFAISDSKLWIVAGDDQFIKVVNEGEGLLIERDATLNNDLTQEAFYTQNIGVGVLCAEKIGIYTITAD